MLLLKKQRQKDKFRHKRFCYSCGSNKTQDNGLGYDHWVLNKPTNLVLCKKCAMRIIVHPIANRIYRPRQILFKDRIIILDQKVRTGICKLCGYTGKTNMHHIQYHDDDPLKDTIEVCASCHMKEHWKLESYRNMMIPKVLDQFRDPMTGRFTGKNREGN